MWKDTITLPSHVIVGEIPSQLTTKLDVQILEIAMSVEMIALRCTSPTLATKLACLIA